MGSFFTNLHVRNASTQSICDALPNLTQSRAYVSPPSNGWATVYTEVTEDQDSKKLCAIADGLSKTLRTDVIAFMVHDSDIAMYWLYRDGKLTDEFNCAPDYFGEDVSDKERERVRGNADVLLPLCIEGTTREQVDELLHPPDGPSTFVEEIIYELAKLLGIDDARASLGFNYFDAEGEDLLPDAGDFEPVGKHTERKTSKEREPDDLKEILPDNPIPLPMDAGNSSETDEDLSTASPVPDMYPIAIGFLTQIWSAGQNEIARVYAEMFKQSADVALKKVSENFDRGARDLLKKSTISNLPTFEELKAARDQGPAALAEFIAKKTPDQMTDIGVGAASLGLADFVAALLKAGLNPNAANAQGRTTLNAAEQHGKDSAVYRVVKKI
jgi:hypothetical protein